MFTHCLHFRERIPLRQSLKRSNEHHLVWVKELSSKLAKFHWQGGYGAFSVSQSNLEEVIRYIENQEEHHKRVTFQDEYRAFLKAYGIAYDERYVWD